jgi:hypothetical protein
VTVNSAGKSPAIPRNICDSCGGEKKEGFREHSLSPMLEPVDSQIQKEGNTGVPGAKQRICVAVSLCGMQLQVLSLVADQENSLGNLDIRPAPVRDWHTE